MKKTLKPATLLAAILMGGFAMTGCVAALVGGAYVALKDSLNVPAVKVSEAAGRDKVRLVAEQFGIESDLAAGPALALGASEASLLEMTGAYAGILNGGSSVTPYGVNVPEPCGRR